MALNPHRFHGLDSLRGIGAASVMLLHFVDMFFDSSSSTRDKLILLLGFPLYRGHEFVVVFFILSAFVLTLPYLAGRGNTYPQFLLKRIVRIYMPYVAALALAVIGASFFHGHLGITRWADKLWFQSPPPHLALQHLLFLGQYDWLQFNTVFWSLVLEMRLSIVFPLLVALILRLRAWVSISLAIVLVAIFRITEQHHINGNLMLTLYTVAPFIVGIVMAQHLDALRTWYGALARWQKAALYVAVTVLFLLHSYVRHLTDFWELVAGAGVIFLAFSSHRAHQFLTFKPFLFLGRISYSLYLVHFPVLMVLTFTLHQRLGKWWIFPIYITTALLAATVFYRWVETPSLRLSHCIAQGKPTTATQ